MWWAGVEDCGHKTALPLKMMLGPSFPKSDAFNKMMWKKKCFRFHHVSPKWMKSRSSVGLWWCCIAHLWGLTFREEGRPRGNLRPRRLLSTLASRDLWSKFQLHLNSSLDLRKASNSANAQLTVCSQRLLRRLLQSSSQFMLPKVLASLESQRPSGFVTWLWSNNFEIERSISRWITPLGIKTTFVSRAAHFQWRRDACRSWKGISRSLWVFSPPPPLHVHTFCASWLLPSLSAPGLWFTARGTAWKSDPVASPCCHHVGGTGSKALVGLLLRGSSDQILLQNWGINTRLPPPARSSPCWWLTAESLYPKTGPCWGMGAQPSCPSGASSEGPSQVPWGWPRSLLWLQHSTSSPLPAPLPSCTHRCCSLSPTNLLPTVS